MSTPVLQPIHFHLTIVARKIKAISTVHTAITTWITLPFSLAGSVARKPTASTTDRTSHVDFSDSKPTNTSIGPNQTAYRVFRKYNGATRAIKPIIIARVLFSITLSINTVSFSTGHLHV